MVLFQKWRRNERQVKLAEGSSKTDCDLQDKPMYMHARPLDKVVVTLTSVSVWMNIIHLVSAAKRDPSPKLQRLQEECNAAGESTCPVTIPREELREKLTPMQYHVTQEKGTERAFTGKFNKHSDEGTYTCIVCGNRLFSSDTKFNSHCGWPSFYDVMNSENVKLSEDTSHGQRRMEVKCSNCGSHVGHVFDDGPKPTGVRYCVNSASLDFKKQTTV